MRLAPKLTLPLALLVLLVLSVSAVVSLGQELSIFDTDMRRDQTLYARVLATAAERESDHAGVEGAHWLINEANTDQNRVLFLYVPLSELRTKGSLDEAQAATIAKGEVLHVVDREVWGHASTWVPLRLHGRTGPIDGALWVQEPLLTQQQALRALASWQVTSTVALSIAWLLLAGFVGRRVVSRPMATLIDEARRIGRGELGRPVALSQRDELGELALEMSRMSAQLLEARRQLEDEVRARAEVQGQLRHADRLSTVGKLASGIAHELGTPLNVIQARASMLASAELSDEQRARTAKIIIDEVDAMTRIIRGLLDFARRSPPSRTLESLDALVSHTVGMLEPLAKKRDVRLDFTPGQDNVAHIDRGQVQQAVSNLVVNGMQSMNSGGAVHLSVSRTHATPPADVGGPAIDGFVIEVRDEGTGIAPDVLPRIFEPFFTTKEVGEGTGLGLSVTYGIARDHGGWISVDSEQGRGSRFRLYLPDTSRSAS